MEQQNPENKAQDLEQMIEKKINERIAAEASKRELAAPEKLSFSEAKKEKEEEKGKDAAEKKETKRKKVGLGSKLGIAAVVAAAGTIAVGRKAWYHMTHPNLKKIASVALMGGTFYWASHCGTVNKYISDTYHDVAQKVSVVSHQEKKISELNEQIGQLKDYQKQSDADKARLEKEKIEAEKRLEEAKTAPVYNITAPAEKLAAPGNKSQELFSLLRKEKQAEQAASQLTQQNRPSYTPQKLEQSILNEYSRLYSKVIYVNKATNKLSLLENQGGELKTVRTYSCSTGMNSGPKHMKGDKATPEGTGKLSSAVFSPQLDDLYGAGFYNIEWKGAQWEGILISGTNLSERIQAITKGASCSNGSVVMTNASMLDLKNRLGESYQSVGVIVEHPSRPLK